MDFALTEEQQAIVELARQILRDRCTQERLREVESGAEWFDRELWADLAAADLIGIALPEDVGGGGFGVLEACLLLAEVGRAVAPIPMAATLPAALVVAELGSSVQRHHLLPAVAAGELVMALALAEPGQLDARRPATCAERVEGGWRVDGVKTAVPAAHLSAALLVSAMTEDGPALFVVEPDSSGVSMERQDTFNHEPTFHVGLSGVVVDDAGLLGGGSGLDGSAVDRAVDLATVAVCAVASGVAEAGMRLTAEYASERKQFDRPIGSFQAVGHRMADCYVDAEAIRLTMLFAASQLDGAFRDPLTVATAKYWACYGASRIAHAGLHVHGGISIDLDYPIHRYFLWAKQLELTLGSGSQQLARIGAALAAEPVAG